MSDYTPPQSGVGTADPRQLRHDLEIRVRTAGGTKFLPEAAQRLLAQTQITLGTGRDVDVPLQPVNGISDGPGSIYGEIHRTGGKIIYSDSYSASGTIVQVGDRCTTATGRHPIELADLCSADPLQDVTLTFPGADGVAVELQFKRKT